MGRELAAFEMSGHGTGAVAVGGQKPTLLRVRGFGRRGMIEPFDLEIREREVVGLAGLLGSGRTEIAKLLFGVVRADQGEASIEEQPASLTPPGVRSPTASPSCGGRKTEGSSMSERPRKCHLASAASKGWVRALSRRQAGGARDHYSRRSARHPARTPSNRSATSPAATSRGADCPLAGEQPRFLSRRADARLDVGARRRSRS